MNDNKKQALPIKVVLEEIHIHDLKMVVVVLLHENVKLNFYVVSCLKIQFSLLFLGRQKPLEN